MKAVKWEEYATKHPHFVCEDTVPKLLEELLKYLNKLNKPFSIIDLGCGDETTLYALHNRGLLENASKVVGVDISKERIKRMKTFCPFAKGIIGDVCNLKQIPDNSFGEIISKPSNRAFRFDIVEHEFSRLVTEGRST